MTPRGGVSEAEKVGGRHNWPCLNTLWKSVSEQCLSVGRKDDKLSELSVEERKYDDTRGKKPKMDFIYFTILPGASFDLFL